MVQIAGKSFTQLENLNLLDELRVKGVLVNPLSDDDIIVETTVNYIVLANDDVVIGTGTLNVTIPLAATAIKRITIAADTGSTVTLLSTGGDVIPAGVSPLTSTVSITLAPTSNGKWIAV